MGVLKNNNLGSYTPICNDCGICLCFDIDQYEYAEKQAFWDEWRCSDCNPNAIGSRKRYTVEFLGND